MRYPDRAYYITLLFQLLEEFEASDTSTPTTRRGAPQVYPDRSLIVFFAIMILKHIQLIVISIYEHPSINLSDIFFAY